MIDRVLKLMLRFAVWACAVLNDTLNRREEERRRARIQRLVDRGYLCSQEAPGMYCGADQHHPACYYARHPKGMAPPRKQ